MLIPKHIEELVLTNDMDNIRLAVTLMQDDKLMYAWAMLQDEDCLEFDLPFVPVHGSNYQNVINVVKDRGNITGFDPTKSRKYVQQRIREHDNLR